MLSREREAIVKIRVHLHDLKRYVAEFDKVDFSIVANGTDDAYLNSRVAAVIRVQLNNYFQTLYALERLARSSIIAAAEQKCASMYCIRECLLEAPVHYEDNDKLLTAMSLIYYQTNNIVHLHDVTVRESIYAVERLLEIDNANMSIKIETLIAENNRLKAAQQQQQEMAPSASRSHTLFRSSC